MKCYLVSIERILNRILICTLEESDNVRTHEELQLRLQIFADSGAVEVAIVLISGVALHKESISTTI